MFCIGRYAFLIGRCGRREKYAIILLYLNKRRLKMYAAEFKTIINEPYIKIPEYEKFKGKEVRVVLLNL